MKNSIYHILILVFLNTILFSCKQNKRELNPKELVGGFDLLKSSETGIDFNNSIKETKYFNHYFFGQIYVGAGVAIGDLDNDGLPEIFFGGNQVGDRLYHNKGNFKFEDISRTSKITRNPGWTWGVTMADVNADGYLDIYVSRNGNSIDINKRRNMLFINNKDLTFTESAIKYGLADIGFSTQAVFFDMDNDGDLDMYQVNQLADKKLLLLNKPTAKDYEAFRDKMYRNDNGKFKDVSKEVGISRNVAYGLSVNAADFNNDGFTDLYVANDYAEPDFMYYNNGDGTFTNVINEKLKHITNLSMGSDTGDINNDGYIDLFTTDMTPEDHYRSKTNMRSMNTDLFNRMVNAGAHYQYMSNTLQINTGLGNFSDIATMAGVAFTDWSWSSLIVDLDNDGLKDIMVSNGIKKDVENSDYLNILKNLDADNTTADELFELSKNTPSQPLSNYVFRNKGNLQFEKVAKDWGFNTPSFSNGMAYGDLDNDGDLDVVTNNIDAKAFVYRNKATGNFLKIKLKGSKKNKFGLGAKAIIYYDDKKQVLENRVTRGYFSSVEPNLFFGLGKHKKVDKVEVIWTNGKSNIYKDIEANNTIIADYSKSSNNNFSKETESKTFLSKIESSNIGLDFKHKENEFDEFKEQVLLPHNLSKNGPFIAKADVNADGLEDVFIGGAVNQSGVLYIQNESGKFTKAPFQVWEKDKKSEDLGAVFFDVDNDGDEDLYIASGGSEFKQGNPLLKDRLYINNGNGVFTKKGNGVPNIYESTQAVKVSDIDNDGDLDLFVGVRLIEGKYTFPASSYLLINNNGVLRKAKDNIAKDLENIGMVTDAVFSDVDKDGDEDLLIVGEWMTIKVLQNNKGTFTDISKELGIDNDSRGIWWSITANDIDNDGDDDYIIGNLGRNNKFKASKEHPFKVYANDFDNNGTNDIVLAKYYKDSYVPVRGRECTSQQMPYVAEKFKDYHSFASSKLVDILPEDKVKDAVIYEITSFDNIVLINESGKLVAKSLPIQAQISPIKSSIVDDFNKDGFKDILVAGNHYGVEVETIRYDAGYGALLLGDGKNNFTYINPNKSGFYNPHDTRSLLNIKIKGNKSLLVSNNDDLLQVFKFNN